MILTRDLSLIINRVLDQLLPPVLRDSWWFMRIPMRLVLGRHARAFSNFKDRAFSMSAVEFGQVYSDVEEVSSLQGETDLNTRCEEAIFASVPARSAVLEVGCGRGHLARRLAAKADVTACDISVSAAAARSAGTERYVAASAEALPFVDRAFDVVVCTHTLEHVQNLPVAIAELRRLARKKVIVVVPRQRPYKHTFSLHIHFFPYAWTLQSVFGARPGALIRDLGDWYYEEPVVSDPGVEGA